MGPTPLISAAKWNISVFNDMDHDSLFRYFDRHKRPYNPNSRPDYSAQRNIGAGPMSFSDIDVEETVMDGVQGEWIRRKKACVKGRTIHGVVLFLHGGSFVRGSRSTDRAFCRELALNSGYDVYSTDYALAPEHPFRQGLDDCFNVYRRLCETLPNGSSCIVLCGESAGATMALAVANYAKRECVALPKGIILISPCVQFERSLPSHTQNLGTDCMLTNFMEEVLAEYFQTKDPDLLKDPLASPINGDFTGFPPVYITASDCEVLRDDAVVLNEKMVVQGVDCTLDMAHGLMHVYPVMTALDESKAAIRRICGFMERI